MLPPISVFTNENAPPNLSETRIKSRFRIMIYNSLKNLKFKL